MLLLDAPTALAGLIYYFTINKKNINIRDNWISEKRSSRFIYPLVATGKSKRT